MKTIVEALQELYVAMGGEQSDVSGFSLNPDVIEQIAALVQSGATKELPAVTASDNNKVLAVVNGAWNKKTATKELPSVTSSDNGKVLTVVNGVWNKAEASGGDDLTAHLTLDWSTTPAKYVLDKSYSEIEAAISAEKDVRVIVGGRAINYSKTKQAGGVTSIIFFDICGYSIDTDSNKITFDCYEIITKSNGEVEYNLYEAANGYKLSYT